MKTSRLALAFALAALLGSLAPGGARATTLTVGSLADDGSTSTLRYLLNSANDGDVIEVPAGTVVLVSPAPIDSDGNADLDIQKNVTILGAGAGSTIIDCGGSPTNGFDVDPNNDGVHGVLEGITVQNCNFGILLEQSGSLDLLDSSVVGNTGAGIVTTGSGNNLVIDGSDISHNIGTVAGGLVATGTNPNVIVTNSTISDNQTPSTGGGILIGSGSLSVFESHITDNRATAGGGGGIASAGTAAVVLVNTEISRNIAQSTGGGGIFSIFSLDIENCDVSDNEALGNGNGGAIMITSESHIADSLISGNRAEGFGGGIFSSVATDLERSTVSGNISDVNGDAAPAPSGGGLYLTGVGHSIRNSVVSDNTANTGIGGGIVNVTPSLLIFGSSISNNTAVQGDAGGLVNFTANSVPIANTTFSGNRALGASFLFPGKDSAGGGIVNMLGLNMNLVNVTFAGNEADGDGGGIANQGNIALVNVTITGNVADANAGGPSGGDGGGVWNNPAVPPSSIALRNSIVAGNRDDSPGGEAPDCLSDFTIHGNHFTATGPNLVQDDSGCEILGDTGSVISDDPQFDTAGLADNDGSSVGDSDGTAVLQTIALQSGSPAIDAGSDAGCAPADERGVERPIDGNGDGEARCDLGAFEASAGGGTTGGETTGGTTGGETTGGTTGGDSGSGGCSLNESVNASSGAALGLIAILGLGLIAAFRKKSVKAAGVATLVLSLFGASNAMANCTTPVTHTVTNLAVDDGSPGTLRFLVGSASVQDCDIIEVPVGTIVYTLASGGPILVDKKITIRGAGAGQTILDANFPVTGYPGFVIDASATGSALTLEGFTVRNGLAGVQVTTLGSLELVDSEITSNANAGILIAGGTNNGLIVSNSTISDNGGVTPFGGILMSGSNVTGIITDSIITGNHGGAAGGGGGIGIVGGQLEIFGTQITDNDSVTIGGGIANLGADLNIENSEISDNVSLATGGGGIASLFSTHIQNSQINGNRALGGGDGGGIFAQANLSVVDSTISGNQADDTGGGIIGFIAVTLVRSTVSDNIADADSSGGSDGGGGLAIFIGANIFDSVFTGNVANKSPGAGIAAALGGPGGLLFIQGSLFDGNIAVNGDAGAILTAGLPTTIRDTTIVNNKATGASALSPGDDAFGGGITTATAPAGGMDIFNTTIANNNADGDGGGILNDGFLSLNHVTLVGNTADANEGGLTGGDGGGLFNTSLASLNNSLLAGNVDASAGAEAPDCFQPVGMTLLTVVANNLIQNLDGCNLTGNDARVLSEDPLLDPAGLADNDGGSAGDPDSSVVVQTIALQAGSPAVDAASDGSCPSNDERGVERPQGEHCDLGAFELQAGEGTTGGTTTGGETTGGTTTGGTTGGDGGSGGCSLIR